MAKTAEEKERKSFREALKLVRKIPDILVVDPEAEAIPRVPSGLIELDNLFGWGPRLNGEGWTCGVPVGRIVEVFGKEATAKTTLCLTLALAYQKAGLRTVFLDYEQVLDWIYVGRLGLKFDLRNPEKELCSIFQPRCLEDGLNAAMELIETGEVGLLVVDSVTAMVPKAELEGEVGDQFMGLQARLMSQTCRQMVGKIARARTTAVFINQVREKIGVMFGNPETTTGGRALKFYSSVRLEMSRASSTGKDGSSDVKIRFRKQKTAPPVGEPTAIYRVHPGQGFDRVQEVVRLGIHFGVIAKEKGEWKIGKVSVGRTNADVDKAIREKPDVIDDLAEEIRNRMRKGEPVSPGLDGGNPEEGGPGTSADLTEFENAGVEG